ncbi:hypothetical protein SK128_007654 [Halocaridina rubra]|uniref:C2H2-type domain-containing protein n=1 Tax=Halocaridina rubra TaxID=373956 RepID=A0AAN8XC57_HALRR
MKFKCTICHLRFSSLTDLNIHKVTHNEEKKFTCDVCGSSFRREYARDKHVKIVHREELEHMCSQCGALFKAKAYLDQHLTHVHTTKERVKCLTCGRDFKTTSILKSHIKLVHNAACHKYSCQLCQKTFAAPKDLARHNKVHTGVKDHMCPICRRCFARKDNMASHLRTHARDSTPSQTTITETLDTSSQPNIQETSEILSMPPALPSTSDMSTSSDFQSETSSCNGLKSGDSVISGGIDISTLPIPNISLPSSISGSSSNSPACIVIPSKPSTSLPVVVFSGGTLSNPSDNLILSSPNHTLTDVPFSNMHSTLNGFTVSQPSASFTNLSSSATTLTYCNNVNISLTRTTTSSHICAVDKSTVEEDNLGNHHVVTFQSYDPSLSNQTSSLTPLPQLSLNSVTPVSSQPCTDSTDPIVSAGSAFNTLSTEQIVLTGGVLSPTGAISYHHQSNPQYTQVIES